MTLDEIKSAVLAGKVVHWKNEAYEVMHDGVGQWFILCRLNGSLTGLTWADGVTMSEDPKDFFVDRPVTATFRKPDGVIVNDSSYHEPISEARAAASEDAHRYGWEFVGVEVGQ